MFSTKQVLRNNCNQDLKHRKVKGPELIWPNFVTSFFIEKRPTSYKEAINCKDATFQKEAIDSELQLI